MIFKSGRGQSGMEFVALVVFVMAAAIVFYPHIRNHMAGRWHLVGDALSYGMVYQEGAAQDCSYDDKLDIWYDNDCFLADGCDVACFTSIPPPAPGYIDPILGWVPLPAPDLCGECLQGCAAEC